MVAMIRVSTALEPEGGSRDRVAETGSAGGRVIVVADGALDPRAAELVCDWAREQAAASQVFAPGAWVAALRDWDARLRRDDVGTCSVVVAEVGQSGVVGAMAGEAGAWLLTGGQIEDLTGVEAMVAGRGVLPTPPLLGSGEPLIEGFSGNFTEGRVLLATDGLWRAVDHKTIHHVLLSSNPDRVLRSLVDAARLRGGGFQDDLAIALCEVE